MLKVICDEDCGNAPKKILIRELNIAFAQGETEVMLPHLADGVLWDVVGNRRITGKAQVEDFLQRAAEVEKAEIYLRTIMTHGTVGGANGTVTLLNGTTYHFCHVYTFNSAGKQGKIKEIISYVIGATPPDW